MTEIPEPTELINAPRPSWAPPLLAVGLAGLVAGLFTWWPYAVIGAVIALFSLRHWLRETGAELARLPRRQRLSTAAIPLDAAQPRDRG